MSSTIITLFLLTFKYIYTINVLKTTSGNYMGRTVNYHHIKIQQYLGIEYGRIKRRFDRAEPIIRQNDSIINATSFGPVCKPTISSCIINSDRYSFKTSCSVNYGIFSLTSSPVEQCLFLNVYIPSNNRKRKKAIFMWIHGGSGQIGTGNVFDGTILAALGDIIVVTFNFRLNLFGFLSSGDERLEGNFGLYDQSIVLDWIHENGEAIGGDIERIVVGGHSAGAPHAYYLAASPFNKGRIRRLILQSGCPFNIWSHIAAEQALERFNVVAQDNLCDILSTFDEILECLREKDYHLMMEHEHHTYTGAFHTNVVVGGEYMNGFHGSLQSNDPLSHIDILIGSNDDEGKC